MDGMFMLGCDGVGEAIHTGLAGSWAGRVVFQGWETRRTLRRSTTMNP